MARPDFSNVWGSTNAPFTAITDTDYKAGWVFRTGAPPRRVNFDYFQNLSDLRHEWLGEQMLLAVGHEWQDDVTYDAYAITRSPVDGQLYRSLSGSNLNNEPSVSGSDWALGVTDNADLLNTLRIDVASASTVDLTANAPNTRHINITGGGAINGFTVVAGQCYFVRFGGAITLTNGAGLVTNRGANIAAAAGDTCIIRATAANTVEVLCGNFLSESAVGTRGQTWQNVTGSRAFGITYTNTTGRPIVVSIVSFVDDGLAQLTVGGLIVSMSGSTVGAGNNRSSVDAIVPNGITYAYGGSAFNSWFELR